MNQLNLNKVDWSKIPAPADDGGAAHLAHLALPPLALPSTEGGLVAPGTLPGWNILFFYPMTGQPGVELPEGWDDIPGARGCTPQSCSFRDHASELRALGVSTIFGISTQTTDYQLEAFRRLHLSFPLLSDASLEMVRALNLPTMTVGGKTLIKRLTLIVRDGHVHEVFYPVFPPDQNATDVVNYMRRRMGVR